MLKQEPVSEQVLVEVYRALVRYWMSRRLSKDKAEDLAQDGILRCLIKAEKWKRKSSLKTFLIEVGKNAGLDVLRKETRREKIRQRFIGGEHSSEEDHF